MKNWFPDESKVEPMVESMVGWASWEREEQGPDISSVPCISRRVDEQDPGISCITYMFMMIQATDTFSD